MAYSFNRPQDREAVLRAAAASYARNKPQPLFARSASDALQCQIDAVRIVQLLKNAGAYGLNLPMIGDRLDAIDDVRMFGQTPLYFWKHDIADVVKRASESYPLRSDGFLPQLKHAFAVFDRPLFAVRLEGELVPLSAISWVSAHAAQTGRLRLAVRGFVWECARCSPVFMNDMEDPLRIVCSDGDPTFVEEAQSIYKWICSASMFVEQRIAVAERVMSLERHTAKRAKSVGIATTCEVIQMRRLDRRKNDDCVNDVSAIEWQCQWLVRGHWRQQFYAKAGRHVPRWIAPYLKGPEDKPLRVPRPTVYQVSR